MTVKQIFSWVGAGFVALLFAILGIQRKKIVKQKEEIKEKEAEVEQAEIKVKQAVKVVEIVKDAQKAEDEIQKEELEMRKEIEEADDEEILEIATALINDFNKSGGL